MANDIFKLAQIREYEKAGVSTTVRNMLDPFNKKQNGGACKI